MKKIIALLSILFFSVAISFAQSDNTYFSSLRTMFQISGSEEVFSGAISQMTMMAKSQNPNVPSEVWSEIENELSLISLNELVGQLVPVYQKYMTQADLDEMIRFYRTPVGQKFAKSTPLIMQESIQIGQTWGMQLGQKIQEKLTAQGY